MDDGLARNRKLHADITDSISYLKPIDSYHFPDHYYMIKHYVADHLFVEPAQQRLKTLPQPTTATTTTTKATTTLIHISQYNSTSI